MAERTPCFRRCSTINVASPNQEGVARMDWEEVWMITDPSAILFIGASLMEVVLFFLLKEAHFYLYSLGVTSRCASRGPNGNRWSLDLVPERFCGVTQRRRWCHIAKLIGMHHNFLRPRLLLQGGNQVSLVKDSQF